VLCLGYCSDPNPHFDSHRAAARHVPGKNRGARIFIWAVEVANEQVFRLHEPINCLDGVSLMDNYAENQKRYNVFDDEWDICTEFNPNSVTDPAWDEEPIEDIMPRYKAPSASSIPKLPSFQPNVFVGNEVPTSVLPSPPSLSDVLYQCYGFLCLTESIHNHNSTMPLNVAAKRVCEGGASLPSSISERNSMCHFLNLLIGTKPIPHSLCDLQDGSLLKQYKQGMVIVECHEGKHHLLSGSISKGKYYLIRPRSTSSSSAWGRFIIFVDDPVAVIHIICQGWGPHVSDIASELVATGIPFSMHVLDPAAPFKPVIS